MNVILSSLLARTTWACITRGVRFHFGKDLNSVRFIFSDHKVHSSWVARNVLDSCVHTSWCIKKNSKFNLCSCSLLRNRVDRCTDRNLFNLLSQIASNIRCYDSYSWVIWFKFYPVRCSSIVHLYVITHRITTGRWECKGEVEILITCYWDLETIINRIHKSKRHKWSYFTDLRLSHTNE